MVEVAEAAGVAKLTWIGEQAAVDDATAFSLLVGVGDVNIEKLANSWRMERGFPTMDAGAFDGQWEEDVGVAEDIVVEEVAGVGLEVGEVQGPATDRNGEAEFALLVSLAAQRQ